MKLQTTTKRFDQPDRFKYPYLAIDDGRNGWTVLITGQGSGVLLGPTDNPNFGKIVSLTESWYTAIKSVTITTEQ